MESFQTWHFPVFFKVLDAWVCFMRLINFTFAFSVWLLAGSVAFSGGLEPDDSGGSLTNTIISPVIDAASSKLENSALKFLPEGSTAEIVFNTIDEGSGSEPYGYAVFVIPISQTKNTLLLRICVFFWFLQETVFICFVWFSQPQYIQTCVMLCDTNMIL